MATFRESSRKGFNEEHTTHEGIRTGALQRIADAVEIIAKDRQQLLNDIEYYKNLATIRLEIIQTHVKEITALKSIKTRYKNQLKKHGKLD